MILLDTHAWLWWLSDSTLLGPGAKLAIESAKDDNGLAVSTMSAWEAAMLVRKGRLGLRISVTQLVRECRKLPFLRFVPVDADIAIASVELEPFHADPADRIIVATALQLGAALVTKDERIRSSGLVSALW